MDNKTLASTSFAGIAMLALGSVVELVTQGQIIPAIILMVLGFGILVLKYYFKY